MKSIRIGCRESDLAVRQAKLVEEAIRTVRPDWRVKLVTMKTRGDVILDQSLEKIGGKGLFIKELDDALLAGRVDACVHSYKDMPMPDNPDLPVVATPRREDPRDVLVLPKSCVDADFSLPLGSSSPRRRTLLAGLFPGWRCEMVRGNIQTRLRKLDSLQFGGLVLAAAGIRRLGLWDRAGRVFSTNEMLPAACQGILAVQIRADGEFSWLDGINDSDARDSSFAERACIEGLGGGCSTPVAAYATVTGDSLSLSGMHVAPDGRVVNRHISGPRRHARELGLRLADQLKGDHD